MQLTIEQLVTLTEQDDIDLAKIWLRQECTQWHTWLAQGDLLFAARFNQRLLAAVKVQVQGTRALLHNLMVREVTRRRGVGSYLLADLQRQLPQVTHWFLPASLQADSPLTRFMLACDFHYLEGGWLKCAAAAG